MIDMLERLLDVAIGYLIVSGVVALVVFALVIALFIWIAKDMMRR